MIFIKEKLYAEGSLKLTRLLQLEDNEPAAASFFITRLQLAGTSAACLFLRSGNGPQEKLSTGGGLAAAVNVFKLEWPGEEEPCLYLGASALFVISGIGGGGKITPSFLEKMKKREKEKEEGESST